MRWLAPSIGAALVAAALSASIHCLFDYAGLFTTMPWLFGIILAHFVFIDEVRRVDTRKTARGRWAGLTYFAVYLVFLIGIYGANFAEIGLNDGSQTVKETHDLWTGVYFSVITWTSVGYGDVTAVAPAARFFAALEAVNGYVVLALFIAALVPVFQELLKER
jgi:hypothetical protein